MSEKYNPQSSERKWTNYWDKEGIYKFIKDDTERELYKIDTPPPTVSGKMHLGHAFSYSQQDFIARYQRMKGKNVFYPFGTDDNGLATNILIEKTQNVKSANMKRSDFIKICLETLEKIRPGFIQDWKDIGMSCDFTLFYSTINNHCRKISQWSFIELYEKGREYRKESPTIWCPLCQTAIAQVELEDREMQSIFNDIIFKIGNENLIIATTRPELLASCVAIFVHPGDKRYKKYVGKTATVPIFGHDVPILVDEKADPAKGTGAVMCCTFGDQTDIEWFKAHNLALRISLTKEGKMTDLAKPYTGLKINEAREKIIEDLKQKGLMISQKQIVHTVNVHERCGTPIEILNTMQWFIKYLDLKDQFLQNGGEMKWYPQHMRIRLDNWINGLQWDWCISRQRHFGVPFPVWYCKKCDAEILASKKDLPVDPLEDMPPVKVCKQCGCKEFVPEKDVLDTWATSSLTPRLAGELVKGSKNYKNIYPMDLRPQAHDIITFWLFNTMVKNQLHYQENPWSDIMISGWALDPHGKKMSKSKGNVIHPQDMITKYGADALRFWAAGSKLGEDLPFMEKDLVTGKKMITKIWNASRFAILHLENYQYTKSQISTIDKWILTKLQQLIEVCTQSYDSYEYSRAKQETEQFFWQIFCDNYLEFVKDRLYNPSNYDKDSISSAKFTLYEVTLNILKLIAPIMPFITEEIYQSYFEKTDGKKSIHLSSWPVRNSVYEDEKSEQAGDMAVDIIAAVRKFKSERFMSLKEEIELLVIDCPKNLRLNLEEVLRDIKTTAKIKNVEFGPATIKLQNNLKINLSL